MTKYKKYKLTNKNNQTHNGYQWKIGKTVKISGKGNNLCTDQVIHFYDHPALAVLFNPIHADFANPKLWEMEVENIVAHDGLKGGCKKATLIKEIQIPSISAEQRVEFAIRVALLNPQATEFKKWAKNWLNGSDRTVARADSAAESAARSAWSAESAWSAASATVISSKFIEIINKILEAK
jgi:hypothetical protein